MSAMLHANFRFHEQCCLSCKYFRNHKTGTDVQACLLLGQTLGLSNPHDIHHRARVCDFWEKRPNTWSIFSEGVQNNPHWVDPHLSRKHLEKKRKQLGFAV